MWPQIFCESLDFASKKALSRDSLFCEFVTWSRSRNFYTVLRLRYTRITHAHTHTQACTIFSDINKRLIDLAHWLTWRFYGMRKWIEFLGKPSTLVCSNICTYIWWTRLKFISAAGVACRGHILWLSNAFVQD